MNIFRPIGRYTVNFLEGTGGFILFCLCSVSHIFRPPFYGATFLRCCMHIGFYSLPVVGMTTLFSGMVLALQMYAGIHASVAQSTIPELIVLSMTRELSPVLTGLMIAGRVGASIAAETATMRVTEQIDALETLSTNFYKYMVVPRLLAGTLMLPLLVFIGDVVGVMGGYIVSVYKLNLSASTYMVHSVGAIDMTGFTSGLFKAATFGCITTLVGCYEGYKCSKGALGVGRATTNAVVLSSVLILIMNYVITEIFVRI